MTTQPACCKGAAKKEIPGRILGQIEQSSGTSTRLGYSSARFPPRPLPCASLLIDCAPGPNERGGGDMRLRWGGVRVVGGDVPRWMNVWCGRAVGWVDEQSVGRVVFCRRKVGTDRLEHHSAKKGRKEPLLQFTTLLCSVSSPAGPLSCSSAALSFVFLNPAISPKRRGPRGTEKQRRAPTKETLNPEARRRAVATCLNHSRTSSKMPCPVFQTRGAFGFWLGSVLSHLDRKNEEEEKNYKVPSHTFTHVPGPSS